MEERRKGVQAPGTSETRHVCPRARPRPLAPTTAISRSPSSLLSIQAESRHKMPRKETVSGPSSAQAQQDAVSDGIDAYELPKSLVTRLARSAVCTRA